MATRILILAPYPQGVAASQRFRFEQYLDSLRAQDYEVEIQSFFSLSTWKVLYLKGHLGQKVGGLISGLFKRFSLLFTLHKYDVLFVHREESPVLFPYISWYFTRVLKKPMIYDFDDAIWLRNTSESNRKFGFLKSHKYSSKLMKWAAINACGNEFLAHQASKTGSEARVIPTVLNTSARYVSEVNQHAGELCVGWTGSHSTLRYLDALRPLLAQLKKKISFRLLIISDEKPHWPELSFEFVPWSKENEVKALQKIHIGLMPLPDEPWAQGKCGFKLLQYMALGIVPVASPTEVNEHILGNGERGVICHTLFEWEEALFGLLADESLRTRLARAGRPFIMEHYSVKRNTDNFLLLFADLKPRTWKKQPH